MTKSKIKTRFISIFLCHRSNHLRLYMCDNLFLLSSWCYCDCSLAAQVSVGCDGRDCWMHWFASKSNPILQCGPGRPEMESSGMHKFIAPNNGPDISATVHTYKPGRDQWTCNSKSHVHNYNKNVIVWFCRKWEVRLRGTVCSSISLQYRVCLPIVYKLWSASI